MLFRYDKKKKEKTGELESMTGSLASLLTPKDEETNKDKKKDKSKKDD